MTDSIIAYDAAVPANVPDHAGAILPYSADSAFPWRNADTDRFPHARHRWITTGGDYHLASIFDVEPGGVAFEGDLFQPSRLREIVRGRLNFRPDDTAIAYCSRDLVDQVQAALAGLPWSLFLATLDDTKPSRWNGKPTIAVQYRDVNNLYDLSIWRNAADLHDPPA